MAIKIPRGEQPVINLPKGSALSTVQDVVGPNFDKLTGFLERTAQQKNANDIRLEDQRVRNKVSYSRSLLEGMSQDYIQKHIIEAEEPPTLDQMDTHYKTFELKFKSRYQAWSKDDDNFKNAFEGDFHDVLNETKYNLNIQKTHRILADATKSWDTSNTRRDIRLSDLKANANLFKERYKIESKILEEDIFSALYANVNIDAQKARDDLYFKFWKTAVVGDNLRNDASGQSVPDNVAIIDRLKGEGKLIVDKAGKLHGKQIKWYGEPLPDSMRTKLIDYYDDQARSQILNEDRYIKRTNDAIVSNAAPEILNNKLDITQIDNLEIVGPDAVNIKTQLKDLRKRVILNQIPKEQDIQTYKHINEATIDGTISSMYEPFLVTGETPTEKNTKGWSILERMKIPDGAKYGAVSDVDGQKWKNFFDQKYSNPFYVKNIREFNAWFKNYEKSIIGFYHSNAGVIPPAATARYEAVKAKALELYLDGIEKGVKPEDLINPDKTEHYIWGKMNGIKRHIPSYATEMKEFQDYSNIVMGKLEADADYRPGGKFGPPPFSATKYENHDEYINSKEYQNWLGSKEYKIWKIWWDDQIK